MRQRCFQTRYQASRATDLVAFHWLLQLVQEVLPEAHVPQHSQLSKGCTPNKRLPKRHIPCKP